MTPREPAEPVRPPEHPHAMPRSLRLRKRREFVRVQRQGARGTTRTLIAILRHARPGTGRFGLTVSKKVGNAVVRNRIKRRLRHLLRTQKPLFADHELVVIVHPPAVERSFAELGEDLTAAIDKARAALSRGPRKRSQNRSRPARSAGSKKPRTD